LEGNTIPAGSTGEKTFTATWSAPIVYGITYVLNGGTNHANNPATYTVEEEVVLQAPGRAGYTFTGWMPGSVIARGSTGDTTFTARWKSGDATLASLTVSPGVLSPAFDAGTTSYTVNVPNEVASIDVAGTATHAAATVSGTDRYALAVGSNEITITVTAEDGTTKNYVVVVAREEARHALSVFTLNDADDAQGLTAKVFPNPVADELQVIVEDAPAYPIQVTVYSSSGVVYLSQEFNEASFSIDLSRYASGILLVKLSSGNRYAIKQIVKL
jgi:uncharacterized repeat protein (TIGR02543 family)